MPAPTSDTRPMSASCVTPAASRSSTIVSITFRARVRSSRGTVKEMSVWPALDTFCTIMSTFTDSSARVRNSLAAIPGRSGTRVIVTFASETSWVTPEMMACSIGSSSLTHVPAAHVKLDRTCTGTW